MKVLSILVGMAAVLFAVGMMSAFDFNQGTATAPMAPLVVMGGMGVVLILAGIPRPEDRTVKAVLPPDPAEFQNPNIKNQRRYDDARRRLQSRFGGQD